eukprot:1158330-Pelagomonas_calceolata.AAC.8
MSHIRSRHPYSQASLVINLFVVSVFATGFYRPDQPPPDIGLKNAGVSGWPHSTAWFVEEAS